MKINSFNNKLLLTQDVKSTETQKKVKGNSKQLRDTIHISAEAQKLNETKILGKDLDEIKSRIKDKYYNSDEIIKSVADAILKDIRQ